MDKEEIAPTWLTDSTQTMRAALEQMPALVLFDVPLWQPELEEILVALGSLKRTRSIRKIVLAATARLEDKVTALDAGADDFLLKPISARELTARLKAVLRNYEAVSFEEEKQSLGALDLYREGMEVAIGDQRQKLSPTEFNLLAYFMERPGHVLSREELLENLWLPCKEIEDRRVVDVYIWRLREKIEEDPSKPRRLLTRRGEGYALIDPEG
ncbi:response regulator transcription factor [Granulicella sp. WH15]|uniref:winged helix-turn-helix domain-containing protein n=1 Tax=Granulicella sp. WH15 TaxID=2602070 RepID=UPI0013A58477|nr:response regulator transcription factor [Granulicella sp. WH15]